MVRVSGGDGHQAAQGTVAHCAQVTDVLACADKYAFGRYPMALT